MESASKPQLGSACQVKSNSEWLQVKGQRTWKPASRFSVNFRDGKWTNNCLLWASFYVSVVLLAVNVILLQVAVYFFCWSHRLCAFRLWAEWSSAEGSCSQHQLQHVCSLLPWKTAHHWFLRLSLSIHWANLKPLLHKERLVGWSICLFKKHSWIQLNTEKCT